jgi:DNA-binding CsgD family transcriptional regulator
MSQAEDTRQQASALHRDRHQLDGLVAELALRDEHSASPAGPTASGRDGPPASALIEEADAINEATADTPLVSTSLVLAAWRGQETRALELIEASIQDATPSGEAGAVSLAGYASAVLYNGLGRYQAALAAAQRTCEHEDLLSTWALPELVEASTRSGSPDVAAAALRRLEERTRAGGVDWTRGIQTCSRALLSDREHADVLYQEALEQLASSDMTLHLARAQLLYGEWLRREGRRVDAREQLRAACGLFSRIGANGFAERARRELLATGATARKRTVETRDDLTAQEAQIARLAGDGYTNPEIGAELFISPRTVEWHLRKVFSKLGISSRKQLRGAWSDAGRTAAPA